MIAIINYGMGNIGSIVNMLKRIGISTMVVSRPDQLIEATKIILPGVGSFDQAMIRINESGFREVLDKKVLVEKIPILGICLGMQLLTRKSEEGIMPGLGYIPADTIRFPNLNGLRVPHMGWNTVIPVKPSKLIENLPEKSRFYFVHSYYVKIDDPNHSILKCNYGVIFDAAIQKNNIFGVQFHPEKSHKFGMRLLENFVNIKC